MSKVVKVVSIVTENASGLWGSTAIASVDVWLHGRIILERHPDRAAGEWRAMVAEDVRRLHAAGAIDAATRDRQLIRVLR